MKLGELLQGLDVRRIDGDLNVEITGLSYDSRQTRPGHLYFSTARDPNRNRANIDDALNRGARAVVFCKRFANMRSAVAFAARMTPPTSTTVCY